MSAEPVPAPEPEIDDEHGAILREMDWETRLAAAREARERVLASRNAKGGEGRKRADLPKPKFGLAATPSEAEQSGVRDLRPASTPDRLAAITALPTPSALVEPVVTTPDAIATPEAGPSDRSMRVWPIVAVPLAFAAGLAVGPAFLGDDSLFASSQPRSPAIVTALPQLPSYVATPSYAPGAPHLDGAPPTISTRIMAPPEGNAPAPISGLASLAPAQAPGALALPGSDAVPPIATAESWSPPRPTQLTQLPGPDVTPETMSMPSSLAIAADVLRSVAGATPPALQVTGQGRPDVVDALRGAGFEVTAVPAVFPVQKNSVYHFAPQDADLAARLARLIDGDAVDMSRLRGGATGGRIELFLAD